MRIGPKYKIARRLGAAVFEKTQTQKFQLSQARKEKSGKRGFSRPKSEFGIQLIEKQKARFTYCLTERQFAKYAKSALSKKDTHALERLYQSLELRADNVAYRGGFAASRLAARQMVSHGHMTVNGKRITIPSLSLTVGDTLGIREGSKDSKLFATLAERQKERTVPNWLKQNEGGTVTVSGMPKYEPTDAQFDLNLVLEFYSR